jgi:hypothetical protein
MKRHPCDIYKIARQCGVILRDGREHSPTSRKPRECYCKPTLREIGRKHGEEHLKLVLMLMTSDRDNARELYSDMIKAVSSVLLRNPDLLKRPNLIDEFNAIDLGSLRRYVLRAGMAVSRTDALKVLLTFMLYPKWRESE